LFGELHGEVSIEPLVELFFSGFKASV